MSYSDFDKRMKKYEFVTRTHLTPRMPVICRIDGRAFHSFTRGFQRPFDEILSKSMQETMQYLCANIQGCVLGYTQSDEITLVLVDYKTLETTPWFDYNIQKCASIAASMATLAFNRAFNKNRDEYINSVMTMQDSDVEIKYLERLSRAVEKGATFDARFFNIPKEEVTNNIYWRQQDAIRNSIQMVGRANFSDKQMFKKNTGEIKDMLREEKGVIWDELPKKYQRGSCCLRMVDITTGRSSWVIDNDIPIFKGESRKYVDDLVYVGE